MLVVRLVETRDVDDLLTLASNANPPLTNLPAWRETLESRVEATRHAVAQAVEKPGAEVYMFVLEETSTKRVVGTATLRAWAGMEQAYYTYRRETLIHASPGLGIRQEVKTLALSHEISHASQLCAMAVSPEYQHHPLAGMLLKKARLAFIRQNPARFADCCAVAFTGVIDAQGQSPFWNSVGYHFFGREYSDIHAMAGRESKSFIAEMMPQLPLYEKLLTSEAREVIGHTHERSQSGYQSMVDEGFSQERHVDIFDAGPVLQADTKKLKTLMNACDGTFSKVDGDHSSSLGLVLHGSLNDFRATICPVDLDADRYIHVGGDVLSALGAQNGEQGVVSLVDEAEYATASKHVSGMEHAERAEK